MKNETVYNGSEECPRCKKLLSPLEAIYNGVCPKCNRAERRRILREKMAGY